MTKWHGGKGSQPRPISDKRTYDLNWDRIFNKKNNKNNNKAGEKRGNRVEKTVKQGMIGKQ